MINQLFLIAVIQRQTIHSHTVGIFLLTALFPKSKIKQQLPQVTITLRAF